MRKNFRENLGKKILKGKFINLLRVINKLSGQGKEKGNGLFVGKLWLVQLKMLTLS